jgi:16S rRNA (cytidine1402-2'-O)-methyltransferase
VTAAVALAGVEAGGFVFGGFLPARPVSTRAEALERLLGAAAELGLPLVLYEAPQRVQGLLRLLHERAPEARLAVGRELTKRHEEVLAGTPAELAARLGQPRGEFTLVISGPTPRTEAAAGLDAARLAAAGIAAGLSNRTVSDLLRAGGMGRREAYDVAAHAGNRRVTDQ